MNHSFDIFHASEYGLHEAIIISNLQFWLAKNRANEKHMHDGRTWTYNSIRAFGDLFPYLTPKQIRSAVDSLVERGILIKGSYNENPYDRTAWFAFQDEEQFLLPREPLPYRARSFALEGKSLTDINQITPPTPKGDEINQGFERFWKAWPSTDRKVDKKGCLKKWVKAGLDAESERIIADVVRRKGTKSWQEGYEPAPATYLNQRRWETEEVAETVDQFGIPL